MAADLRFQNAHPLSGHAGESDKAVAEHLDQSAQQDMEKYLKGGDEDDEMLAKLRAELHAEQSEVELAPAVEGSMQ